MSNGSKTFHIGDILTAMTGRLVSPSHVDGLYGILDHMTGESLMTHQLPRGSREVEDILRERFPDLAAIEIPDWSDVPVEQRKDAVLTWLGEMAAEHGETREVAPLDEDDHTHIDPIAELKMMRPDAEIIPVQIGDES